MRAVGVPPFPPASPSSLRSAPSVSGPKAGRIHLPQHSLRSRGEEMVGGLISLFLALDPRPATRDPRLNGHRQSPLGASFECLSPFERQGRP